MNMYEFNEAVVAAIEAKIPEPLKEDIEVTVREVIKTNDEVLHGVAVLIPERNMAPTIYLEECYRDFENGMTIDEIADGIIEASMDAYQNAPNFDEFPMNYENIKEKLVVQLVDAEKNKARLKDLVYEVVGNGFVLIPYVVMKEDAEGSMRAAVTKDLAKEYDYDIAQLMETAFFNTAAMYQPTFTEISGMFSMGDMTEQQNPMRSDFTIDPDKGMYVLSNATRFNGANVLFYPGMTKRIGDILGKNYYVLPSSIHEMIIVPEGTGPTLRDFHKMVKEANSTVVEPRDVLSDKVLFFDRERNRLIEPNEKDRTGDERSDR